MNQAIEPGFAAAGGFQPLYREVKRLLTQSLIEGEWPAGTALPSETRLAKRYSVSIGTLRKAIDELVAERIVTRHQGRGTFVATPCTGSAMKAAIVSGPSRSIISANARAAAAPALSPACCAIARRYG